MKLCRWLAAIVFTPGLFAQAKPGVYVVLTGFAPSDAYHAAAEKLAAHHQTPHLVPFDPAAPDAILDELRELEPAHVAIVLRPEQIDVNSVRAILKMAARVDGDPFVDFDYGYITGATAEEALRLVENIVAAAKKPLPKRVGQSAVWGDAGACTAKDEAYQVGPLSFPGRSLVFRAADGQHGRDQEFLDANLASLEGCGAILMGGHGMPWEIVSGPRAEDMDRLELFPSVVFNYACYTAVTRTYAEREFDARAVRCRLETVASERSFALALLRRGVVGYVAYVTPRPAGPEMSIDFQRALAGEALGATRRHDYAKVVLGYLGFGEAGLAPPVVEEGGAMPRAELDMVRHLMLDEATGGILYGDPTFRPFPVVENALPLRTEAAVKGGELEITMRLRAADAFVWGADPFRRFAEGTQQMAMKVYDRVPLPREIQAIRSVRVDEARWGRKTIETLPVIWAEEQDRGQRYLHVKANFARNAGAGDIVVRLVASPRELPAEVQHAAVAREAAAGPAERVREANQKLLHDPSQLQSELADVQGLGKAGFDAVLELIRAGEAHHLTHRLLHATKVAGGEQELLRLARGKPLPNYGTWIVLRGLAAFDTEEVRAYLLERLASDRDAGTFHSAAEALAELREARGVELVAARLMEFGQSWSGVQWQLVHAMGSMGGADAVRCLAAYVGDERAVHEVALTYALDHLTHLDRAAARKAIEALQKSKRYAGFAEQTRAHFEKLAR